MSTDVWIGAVTTLAGAAVGGVISFVLSRQQIKEARRQRSDDAQRMKEQYSRERRFDCYADFPSQARAYRNAIRSLGREGLNEIDTKHIDSLAADADAGSSRVFLIVESSDTYEACSSLVHAIGVSQASIHAPEPHFFNSRVSEINREVAACLRRFQVASREELSVTGVNRISILGNYPERRSPQTER
jgi:hypothetical protein